MLRRIEDILKDADAETALEADDYLSKSYSSSKPTPEFTRLKEAKYLGYFAEQYNVTNSPTLAWARRNDAGSGHADFSVYDQNKVYLCDIELTALFSTPAVKDPRGYKDFSPFPIYELAPDVMLQDIEHPRPDYEPYRVLKRTIATHLRDKYPSYWLVIYDNEHGVTHPNLTDLRNRVVVILDKLSQQNKIPPNLKEVWLFDMPNAAGQTLLRAWP
jgi:hypothetical protein